MRLYELIILVHTYMSTPSPFILTFLPAVRMLPHRGAMMRQRKQGVTVVEMMVKRRVVLEQKTCKQCGEVFLGIKRKQYCSRACVEKAAYWRNPEAYRESRLKSYHKQKEGREKKATARKS